MIKLKSKIEKLEDLSIDQSANVKSNQRRIDAIESSLTWITRTVIGGLVAGAISALFFLARP